MKTIIAFVLALSTFGCVGPDPDPSKPTAAPPALSCLGVLSCVNQNCTTDACVDTCMQQGSPEAQTEVTNLATCNQNAGCQDATCLQKNCMTELEACVSTSTPPQVGTPSDGQNLPPGNVPAELVGTWNANDGFDPSYSQTFQFNADGTGRYAQGMTGGLGGCDNTTIIDRDGPVVIDATTITFYSETAATTQSLCGQQGTSAAQLATTVFTYTWQTDGSLLAVEQSCAQEYADSPGSIGLYCTSTFQKQ
ncbi:MAG TPA: hypothetical protein VGH87_14850 [Polyangiaceae bacterium]